MSIAVSIFLDAVRANASRVTSYRSGHDGSDGQCDCIGLIIGALRMAGVGYNRLHGSNWFIRNEVSGYGQIKSASDLRPGFLVFKAYEKGDSSWALPERYASSADQRDYYHVGVVVSASPLEIWHCTSRGGSGGVYTDNNLGKWRFAAMAAAVEYPAPGEMERDDMPVSNAVVRSDNGLGANLRASKSTNATLIAKIPEGASITVQGESGAWSAVTYEGRKGYVMSRYITRISDSEGYEPTDAITVTISREMAGALVDAINRSLYPGGLG